MKFKDTFFLFCLLSILSVNALSAKTHKDIVQDSPASMYIDGDIITHVVAKGETVYSIAAAYNISVQDIYKLNPNAEKGIRVWDKLQIPKIKRVVIKYSDHLIDTKETLFSVSRMYKLSVQDIKDANPGLDESNFVVGKTIRIPFFDSATVTAAVTAINNTPKSTANVEHKVKKQETLYSIGKTYNVSSETIIQANPAVKKKGLKEGMVLTIPAENMNDSRKADTNSGSPVIETPKEETLKVAVLLPFLDKEGTIQKEKLAEYYEGFLIALSDMKKQGLNAEIYTFDIGAEKNTQKLEALLGTTELNSLNLILGGISKQEIDVLSKFSKNNNIKYVIPFGGANDVDMNDHVFRMTTSHATLYPKVIAAFIKKYKDHNIIFVSESESDNNKTDLTDELKKGLSNSGIQFKSITGSTNIKDDLNEAMTLSMKNILVPTSSSESTLRRMIALIRSYDNNLFSLFGYPEWQTYTRYTKDLYKYDTTIYSIFFLDDRQPEVQNFATQYKKWYNKNVIMSYPKYAYLGYDAGLYLLTALKQYGTKFDSNISSLNIPTLQSAISFEKMSGNGGYVNKGLYFINYKTDSSIEKTNVGK